MEKPKKSLWNLLNPVAWLEGAFGLLAAIFSPILRLFGLMPPHQASSGMCWALVETPLRASRLN